MTKIKAKELTSKHLGERITHTDEWGTESSKVLVGICHNLSGAKLNLSTKEVKAYFQVVTLIFLDGTKRTVPAIESLGIEEGLSVSIKEPNKTGLR